MDITCVYMLVHQRFTDQHPNIWLGPATSELMVKFGETHTQTDTFAK